MELSKKSKLWITEQEKKAVANLLVDIEVSMMFGENHSHITELHSKVYEELMIRLAIGRISKEKFDKLTKLNDTRDLENMTLALKILLANEGETD